jgi:hypothetical protein
MYLRAIHADNRIAGHDRLQAYAAQTFQSIDHASNVLTLLATLQAFENQLALCLGPPFSFALLRFLIHSSALTVFRGGGFPDPLRDRMVDNMKVLDGSIGKNNAVVRVPVCFLDGRTISVLSLAGQYSRTAKCC